MKQLELFPNYWFDLAKEPPPLDVTLFFEARTPEEQKGIDKNIHSAVYSGTGKAYYRHGELYINRSFGWRFKRWRYLAAGEKELPIKKFLIGMGRGSGVAFIA